MSLDDGKEKMTSARAIIQSLIHNALNHGLSTAHHGR